MIAELWLDKFCFYELPAQKYLKLAVEAGYELDDLFWAKVMDLMIRDQIYNTNKGDE